MTAALTADDRPALVELAPVLRRSVTLEPHGVARLRMADAAATILVRLPFGVLISRTVRTPPRTEPIDLTARAADLLDWIDSVEQPAGEPERRDHEWRAGLPPTGGWHRIETVPDDVVRDLVRSGAVTLKEAAAREGVPGAQPRSSVADALLDSVVLTVSDDTGLTADVTLRAISALIRMGFLPRGGHAHVDAHGRWIRVVAEYGTVYLERAGHGLAVL